MKSAPVTVPLVAAILEGHSGACQYDLVAVAVTENSFGRRLRNQLERLHVVKILQVSPILEGFTECDVGHVRPPADKLV
ncbi:hypothetical protein [Shinella sp. WSC3-e]|uniref:hypothetical protein n=1 Tax=Shinella sp. WSC3-e TaxID=3113208 RepID=UPI0030C85032